MVYLSAAPGPYRLAALQEVVLLRALLLPGIAHSSVHSAGYFSQNRFHSEGLCLDRWNPPRPRLECRSASLSFHTWKLAERREEQSRSFRSASGWGACAADSGSCTLGARQRPAEEKV